MKIAINRVVTDWEFEKMDVPKLFVINNTKEDMSRAVAKKIINLPGLFTENPLGTLLNGTEYRFECIVLNMESFQNILKLCRQYYIPGDEIEKVFNMLINEV